MHVPVHDGWYLFSGSGSGAVRHCLTPRPSHLARSRPDPRRGRQGQRDVTFAQLLRVELPLARPPILTGVRVSTQMLMGIAATAAFASGPGLGNQIFRGISSLGSANTLNEVLSGTLGIVVPALPFDAGYVLIGRLTISRGIRG